MNKLEFIASIIGSLAWPTAATVIFIILRKPAIRILNNLQKIRYGDIEMDFGKEVEKLEEQARKAGIEITKPSEYKESEESDTKVNKIQKLLDTASKLAIHSPDASISYAWTAIENSIMQAVMRLGISADYPPHNSVLKNISLLEDQKHIDTKTSNVIVKMKKLRDSVTHAHENPPITAREAREFIYLSKSISDKISKL